MTISPLQQAWLNAIQDAEDQNTIIEQQTADQAAYRKQVTHMFADKYKNNPELLLYFIFTTIFTNTDPNNHANIFGLQDDEMGISGKALRVMGDMTQVTAALQNLTSNKGVLEPGCTDLESYAKNLDQILDALGANPNVPGDVHLQTALGGDGPNSALSTLKSQYLSLRQQVNYKGDTDPGNYNPTDPKTASFDTDPSNPNGKITSFAELAADLGEKDDPKQAQEAAKAITDAFGIVGSTTQSTNAALNEEFSQEANAEKSNQSAFTAFLKSLIDLINGTITNQTK